MQHVIDMQHEIDGHGHAAGKWTSSMGMEMQHGHEHGHTAWRLTSA
jgi:hypothetical protein